MTIILNPKLLKFLIASGYRFCLSKTSCPKNSSGEVVITLTPVFRRPQLKNLPAGYDTYYNIVLEPVQMAETIDGTLVLTKLDRETFTDYIKSVLKPVFGKKLSYE